MSDPLKVTGWADYEELKAQRDETMTELNASREEVGRLMSHNASLSENLDRANAEVERFRTQEVDLTLELNQMVRRNNQWKAVARKLYLALANDGMQPNNILSRNAGLAAMAAYKEME